MVNVPWSFFRKSHLLHDGPKKFFEKKNFFFKNFFFCFFDELGHFRRFSKNFFFGVFWGGKFFLALFWVFWRFLAFLAFFWHFLAFFGAKFI